MSIDLHCHSKFSDATMDVSEILELAQLRNIQTISITDHDTFAGSNCAVKLGQGKAIEIIPGTEISCYDYSRNRKVHIMCYGYEDRTPLEKIFQITNQSRQNAAETAIKKVCEIYKIPKSMILERAKCSTAIYKQHIMHALLDAGYADELFGEVLKKLFRPPYGLAVTKNVYPDVFEILNLIRNCGGVAVLAHPDEYNSIELMIELCEKNLIDGIEKNHPRNAEETKKLIAELTEKHQLFTTGGTDFHGGYSRKGIPLGSFSTDYEQLILMKKKILERKWKYV